LALYACETDLYQELGGFDVNCFMYSDDGFVLCRNAVKENRTEAQLETTVIHYAGESTVKDGIYIKTVSGIYAVFFIKALNISVFFSVFMKTGILFFLL
jgi:GT2 family glycosyltransferase